MSKKEGNINATNYSLKKLMNFLKKNPVFIPGFQRGFVWGVKDITELYESVFNNDPIGTIVVWKTKNKQNLNGRPFFNNIEDGRLKKEKYYIIDGQQRLLSLFFLFNKNLFTKQKQALFHNYYDPEASSESEILDFRKFYFSEDKKTINYSSTSDEDEIKKLKWRSFNWFEKELSKLNYNFVIEEVSFSNAEKEIKDALGSFEKLNRKGKKLTVEDIFLAHIWHANPEFEERFHAWRETQRRGGGNLCANLDEGIIINTFSIIYQITQAESNKQENGQKIKLKRGLKELLKIAEEIENKVKNDKGVQSIELLNATFDAFKKAIDFLQNICGIRSFEQIPSQSALLVMAIYFWHYGESIPSKKDLRKWFWRVCLASRYSGKGYSNILKDPIKMIENGVLGHSDFSKLTKPELKNSVAKTQISAGNSSFIKSVKFILLKEQQQYRQGGEDIFPTWAKKAEDHFFPKFLAREGKDILEYDYVNNIANLVFLTNKMNSNKSKILPFMFLEKLYYKEKKDKKDKITKKEIKIFLKANLIPKKYHDFVKQAEKEKRFYDENGDFKRGKKGAIWDYYYKFNELRKEIIVNKLYALQI